MPFRSLRWATSIRNLDGARTRDAPNIYRHVLNPPYQSRAPLKIQFSSPALSPALLPGYEQDRNSTNLHQLIFQPGAQRHSFSSLLVASNQRDLPLLVIPLSPMSIPPQFRSQNPLKRQLTKSYHLHSTALQPSNMLLSPNISAISKTWDSILAGDQHLCCKPSSNTFIYTAVRDGGCLSS